jgi:AcrR family transcriptional regulator
METQGTPSRPGTGAAQERPQPSFNDARSSDQRRLPRGSHGIPTELIAQNQRERIMAATAQISAERGFVGTTVRDIVTRAGVSSATFYREFDNLGACMTATFWELHRRLMSEIDIVNRDVAAAADLPRAALRRSLELFATDPAAARFLTVEIIATGTDGARAQHEAIARTAKKLGIEGQAGWAVVAMVCSLVAQRVIAARPESLPELEWELDAAFRARRPRACSQGSGISKKA